MPVSLKISSSNLTNFINKLQKSLDNFSLVGTESEVKKIASNAFAQNILTRGGIAPLKDGSGRTPLVDQGNLLESARNPTITVEGNKYVATFNGEGAKTLALHNKGFTVNRKLKKGGTKKYKVVQRKVVKFNNEDVQEIRKIVVKQFKKILLG